MDFLSVFAGIVNIIVFCLVSVAVMKVFQAASTLIEIKEVLTDIKRSLHADSSFPRTQSASPHTGYKAAIENPDEVIRRLSEEPGVEPEVVTPKYAPRG